MAKEKTISQKLREKAKELNELADALEKHEQESKDGEVTTDEGGSPNPPPPPPPHP